MDVPDENRRPTRRRLLHGSHETTTCSLCWRKDTATLTRGRATRRRAQHGRRKEACSAVSTSKVSFQNFEVVVVTITFISSRCSRHPLVTRHSAGSSLTSVRALDRADRVLIKHPVARSGSLGPDEEVNNRKLKTAVRLSSSERSRKYGGHRRNRPGRGAHHPRRGGTSTPQECDEHLAFQEHIL